MKRKSVASLWLVALLCMPTLAASAAEAASAASLKEGQKLAEAYRRLRDEAASLTQRHRILEEEREEWLSENNRLERELTHLRGIAAAPLALDKENDELRVRLRAMDLTEKELRQTNLLLQERTERDWFIVGAGVSLLALLAGFLLGSLGKKRRWQSASWSSL